MSSRWEVSSHSANDPTLGRLDSAPVQPVIRWSKCPLCQTHRFEDEPHECVVERRIREIVREEMSKVATTPADLR
jgi:hypothetical protein